MPGTFGERWRKDVSLVNSSRRALRASRRRRASYSRGRRWCLVVAGAGACALASGRRGDLHQRVGFLGRASALTMVSAGNVTEATPSVLAGGSAFTVTWDGNGTGTVPTPTPTGTATAPGTGGGPGRHHHHHGFGG